VEFISKEIKRKKIRGSSGELVKIEIFVHGALCMAISGKCYLSLHTQNASANRGACVQNCRRPYLVKDTETGEELMIENEYIMSPKDLCTIDILDQVIESAVNEGTFSQQKVDAWKNEMDKVYNRGFWEGYYLGRNTGEWTPHPGSAATEKKVYVGKGTKYYPKINVGEFIIESGSLKIGDTLMVTGPKCGMVKEKIEILRVNGIEGNEAVKGDRITFSFATKVSASDKLYKIVEATNA
jgi:putative protease